MTANTRRSRKPNDKSAPLLAAIVESLEDPVISKDFEGIITSWNPAAARIFGYSAAEMVGQSILRIVPEDHWREEEAILERLRKGEQIQSLETVRLGKDGSRLDVSVTISPIRGDGGKVLGASTVMRDITEKKRAEEAFLQLGARSEQQRRLYDTILSSTPDLVYVFDLDHRFTYANAALLQMWGKTWDEAIGKNCLELGYEPWHAAMHDEEIEQVIATRQPIRGEVPFTGTQGRRIYDYIFVPVFGSHGEVEAIAGTTRDVTGRKTFEETLRRSEERFRALVMATSDVVYSMSPDWSEMRLLEGDLFIPHTRDATPTWLEKYIPPEDQAQVLSVIQEAIRHKGIFELEHRVIRDDSTLGWTFSRAIPLLDAEGRITEWFGAARDVTQRKRAEEALRESEAVLRTVTSEAQVGLVMVDKQRRYLYANQTYADILGLRDSNIVGRSVSSVVGDLYEQIKSHLDQAFAGERVTSELHLPKHPRTGEERYYEVVYEPRLTGGQQGYILVVLSDITQRKKIEQTLERLVAQRTASLTEMVGELEAFSYTIAHDMRAPLRAMQSFSEILTEDHAAQLSEEAKTLLRRIALSANRLDHLIQDVLNYSRIVRADLQLKPVEIGALIEEIVHTYPNLLPQNVDIRISNPVPDVLGNRAGLTQVIANLLGNAVKFVAPGTRPHIVIRAEEVPGGIVRIGFEDNGIGIEESAQKRLFQMFQRASRLGLYEGTGMGLAIVRKAVERMGGRVGVESAPGKGSLFWIELKAVPPESRRDPPDSDTPSGC